MIQYYQQHIETGIKKDTARVAAQAVPCTQIVGVCEERPTISSAINLRKIIPFFCDMVNPT